MIHCRRYIRIKISVLLLWGACLVAGCGYQFRSTAQPLTIDIQSLAIPLIQSTSSTRGFEGELTEVIRQEFISHAAVPIVSREKADVVLVGRVHDISTQPLSYSILRSNVGGEETEYEETNKRELIVEMEAELIDRATGRAIWSDKAMEESASFAVGEDPLVNRYNQRAALRKIAQRLARRFYSKTMDRF